MTSHNEEPDDFDSFGTFMRGVTTSRPNTVGWNGLTEAIAGTQLREEGISELDWITDFVGFGKCRGGAIAYPRCLNTERHFTFLAVPLPRMQNDLRPMFNSAGDFIPCRSLFPSELRDRRGASDSMDDCGVRNTDVVGWMDLYLWMPPKLACLPDVEGRSTTEIEFVEDSIAQACNDNLFQKVGGKFLIKTKLWFPCAWSFKRAILNNEFEERFKTGTQIPVFLFRHLFFQKTTAGGTGSAFTLTTMSRPPFSNIKFLGWWTKETIPLQVRTRPNVTIRRPRKGKCDECSCECSCVCVCVYGCVFE